MSYKCNHFDCVSGKDYPKLFFFHHDYVIIMVQIVCTCPAGVLLNSPHHYLLTKSTCDYISNDFEQNLSKLIFMKFPRGSQKMFLVFILVKVVMSVLEKLSACACACNLIIYSEMTMPNTWREGPKQCAHDSAPPLL